MSERERKKIGKGLMLKQSNSKAGLKIKAEPIGSLRLIAKTKRDQFMRKKVRERGEREKKQNERYFSSHVCFH